MSNSLTLIGALCPQHFENMAIALRKTANEYFPYLFGSWNCSRTKFAKNGQIQLQHMYATGPRRLYFTRSFRSTGPSFRLNWPVMTSIYQRTLDRMSRCRVAHGCAGAAVKKEFDEYLKCGRLEHGFLRVRCETCHDEKLVAFSCKRRGFCPSCGARRMADSAALLIDEVLPHQP